MQPGPVTATFRTPTNASPNGRVRFRLTDYLIDTVTNVVVLPVEVIKKVWAGVLDTDTQMYPSAEVTGDVLVDILDDHLSGALVGLGPHYAITEELDGADPVTYTGDLWPYADLSELAR